MRPELEDLAKEINKKHPGTVMLGSDIPERNRSFRRATTGVLQLDVALGGGWPLGTWQEIIGEESSGKTTLCFLSIAANQRKDPEWTCLWVAAEPFAAEYAEEIGVDLSRVILIENNVMEVVYQSCIDYSETKAVDAIYLDSLPSLVPQAELDGTMDDRNVGLQARLTNQFFRIVGNYGSRLQEDDRPMLGVIINQWRDQIGVMYGDPRTTPGGRGKNFSYFTRTEIRRTGWRRERGKKSTPIVGHEVTAKVAKNKSARPQLAATYHYYFENDPPNKAYEIDRVHDVLSTSLALGTVVQGGGYYSFEGNRFAHGRDEAEKILREDDLLREKIAKVTIDVVMNPEKPHTSEKSKTKKVVRKKGGK